MGQDCPRLTSLHCYPSWPRPSAAAPISGRLLLRRRLHVATD
jgi:hypothetical protein